MILTISGDSNYQISLSEFIEGNIRVKNNKEKKLCMFRDKTFSEGTAGASFNKRLYLEETKCENFTDTVSGIDNSNNHFEIYYELTYSSHEDDNKKVNENFEYDKQFICNQCEKNDIDYELKQTRNEDHDVIYKLIINAPVSDVVADLQPQSSDMTIEQSTSQTCTDKKERLENNPDSVEQIWSDYQLYLVKFMNHSVSKEHVYSCEQINIGSAYIRKKVVFQPLNKYKCCVRITLLVRSCEESSEIIAKETTDKIDLIRSQCEEADLYFSCEEKITDINITPYNEINYKMIIQDKELVNCSI